MKWTAVYLPAAEQELAALWLDATTRSKVTEAAHRIDRILRDNPEEAGESRQQDEKRILFVDPLGVLFQIKPDDRLVEVIHVWKFR